MNISKIVAVTIINMSMTTDIFLHIYIKRERERVTRITVITVFLP